MERALRKHLPEGKFSKVSPQRSRTMKAVKGKGNKSTEWRLRMALVHSGLCGWQVRPSGIIGTPDFVFPKKKLVIFVDGCFWHGCPKCGHLPKTNAAFWKAKIERNRARDKKTFKELKKAGFTSIRFWEHALRENPTKCLRKIQKITDTCNK